MESTNRSGRDYFHLGVISLGAIVCIIGVVIVSWRTVACGLALTAFGIAYFGLED